MKFKMEMDEADLKEALSEWASSKHDLEVETKDITLTITRGQEDRPGMTPPDKVSVEIEFNKK